MVITMLATGSRGDTQPYVALGVELQKRGHDVCVTGSAAFADLITGNGLTLAPLAGHVAEVATSDLARNARNADNPLKFVLSLRDKRLQTLVVELQRSLYDACIGADVIVYHPGGAIGHFIGRKLGIPTILAAPFPMTPTRAYPSLLFYDSIRLGGGYNLLTHRLFEQGFWWALSGPIKRFWQDTFGRIPPDFANPFPRQRTVQSPTLIGCSDLLFPRSSDWPAHVYNTGFWFLDAAPDWQPPVELTSFLESGPPPVYVGFGSIGSPDEKEEITCLVLDALRLAGQRGVLATGWHGLADLADAGDDVFILKGAPHAWLFPRMAAVVHHGGAGTTAAGLRAGVPSAIVPHGNDQFAWGRRVYELGVGAQPVPRKRLRADRLADAIQQALHPARRKSAAALGRQIAAESGVATAADIIVRTTELAQPISGST